MTPTELETGKEPVQRVRSVLIKQRRLPMPPPALDEDDDAIKPSTLVSSSDIIVHTGTTRNLTPSSNPCNVVVALLGVDFLIGYS